MAEPDFIPNQMVDVLRAVVLAESPSDDLALVESCAGVIAHRSVELIGRPPEFLTVEGRTHLRWRFGDPRVLLLGHFDTVWPKGTTERWPFTIENGRASGPGVFDMKAGIVQGFFAVASLTDKDGIEILLNSDEELGSQTSKELIEESARNVKATLVLEPSHRGALKIARKGVSGYTIEIEGRAAHAGLEPEKGANALIEMAHQVLNLAKIARPKEGTTVTPTVSSSPTAKNTVPAKATVWVDVRVETIAEQDRVDREMHGLEPVVEGTTIMVKDGPERPPLEPRMTMNLFALAQSCARELGLGEMKGVSVGGGSDGNLTAAMGIPTLDGLGAVGDGAHAEGEHVVIEEMPKRAALLAQLIEAIRSG